MERNRKFIYEIREIDEKIDEIIENIKQLDTNYQIIGYNIDENEKFSLITGFLYYKNARSIKNIRKLTGINNLKSTIENPYYIHKRISEFDTFWEKGRFPNQSNYKKNIEDEITPMTIIMNQHQKLLEHTFEQQKQIIEQQQELLFQKEKFLAEKEKILLEQNKNLIEQNIILKQSQNINLPQIDSSKNNITNSHNKTNLTSNTINSHNKTFNINMFLNDECKDAITLMDFIKNIQIENEDLFYAKEHGFTQSMIRLLENGLKNYDITERPLHCTDTKRETIHIKNDSGWHKEVGSKSHDISNAIKTLSRKKMDKASKYISTDGKCEFASKKFEENLIMMKEVSNGLVNQEENIKKIVKNIVNKVKLEKN
jgi:hypothetical protein